MGRKEDELKKCLYTLGRLGTQMESLRCMDLGAAGSQYLQGSLFYLEGIRTNLNNILLSRKIETEQEERPGQGRKLS